MNKIDWIDLTRKINRKMVEFERKHEKSADTLIVGREEYAVLEANKNSEGIDGNYSLWSMGIHLDESKNSYLKLIGKKVNFLKVVDYPFTPHRVKVEVVVPSRLSVPFVSFLDSQNTSDIGVQIVGGGRKMDNRTSRDLASRSLVYYQISVKGINKDMVFAFVNYLYEIEKAYTIELTCDICGKHRWIECRDTHYIDHLDGSKDLCKGCKIHE